MNSDVHSAILRGRWQIRATTRPILPEAQRTTAQNLKPHARRRTATATVHDGTEAGLLLTTNSISSGGLVSKPEAHTHRLSCYVGSCLRRGTPLALQRNAREEHPSVRPSHGNKVLGGIEKKCSGGTTNKSLLGERRHSTTYRAAASSRLLSSLVMCWAVVFRDS